MAEKAIYVQHEIVTDISHPIKGLSCLWLSEFVSPCAAQRWQLVILLMSA